jgi:3-oxoacyl-[acyl-carrier-protein] synthase I
VPEALPILAFTQVSALGATVDEARLALREGRTGIATGSAVLPGATAPLGEVRFPLPELPVAHAAWDSRAARLLARALEPVHPVVDALAAAHGPGRVAVVVGTSASGNRDLEDAVRADGGAGYDYHRRQSFGAPAVLAARLLGIGGPAFTVSTACSSGAHAAIAAARLIRTGACDAAVAASVDALCWTTYHGFRSLGVVDERPCRPFDADRRGLNLGEGAAAMVLARPGAPARVPLDGPSLFLVGWGAGSEAHHMTAPDPEGDGAARVMAEALARAGLSPDDIGYVNCHGTATPANDAAESKGVVKVLGPEVPCSSTKGLTGHLLGAAAGVEAALTLMALQDGVLPRNAGLQDLDPEVAARILRDDEPAPGIRFAMSNSFAFGGNDACLLFGVRR